MANHTQEAVDNFTVNNSDRLTKINSNQYNMDQDCLSTNLQFQTSKSSPLYFSTDNLFEIFHQILGI
jgi:hypothetical protein